MMRRRDSKYNAKRCTYDNHNFASQGERDCYHLLKLMERAGEIKDIECQVTTPLIAGITHKTDFRVWDNRLSEHVWYEYKGFEDQRWRDIRKLWSYCGPGILRVIKGRGLRMAVSEEILPENMPEKEAM